MLNFKISISFSLQKVSYGRREVASVGHRAHSADRGRGQAVLREVLLIPSHMFTILDKTKKTRNNRFGGPVSVESEPMNKNNNPCFAQLDCKCDRFPNRRNHKKAAGLDKCRWRANITDFKESAIIIFARPSSMSNP